MNLLKKNIHQSQLWATATAQFCAYTEASNTKMMLNSDNLSMSMHARLLAWCMCMCWRGKSTTVVHSLLQHYAVQSQLWATATHPAFHLYRIPNSKMRLKTFNLDLSLHEGLLVWCRCMCCRGKATGCGCPFIACHHRMFRANYELQLKCTFALMQGPWKQNELEEWQLTHVHAWEVDCRM